MASVRCIPCHTQHANCPMDGPVFASMRDDDGYGVNLAVHSRPIKGLFQ